MSFMLSEHCTFIRFLLITVRFRPKHLKIMWCPESLKVNRFKEVAIPTPTEYVQRYGLRAAPDSYSGDNMAVPAMSKIQQLNVAESMNARALKDEAERSRLAAEAAKSAPAPTETAGEAN